MTAATSPELRPLFRALINRWHPDRTRLASKRPLFEALTREILSAYEAGDIGELKRIDRDGLNCLHSRISDSKFGPKAPARESQPRHAPAAPGASKAAGNDWWEEFVSTGRFNGAPEQPFTPYKIPWADIFANLVNPYYFVFSAFGWEERKKANNAAAVASGAFWTYAAWQAWLWIAVLDPVHPAAATTLRVLLVLAWLPMGILWALIGVFASIFALLLWVSNMFLVPLLSMIHPTLGYAPVVVISIAALACVWEKLGDEIV